MEPQTSTAVTLSGAIDGEYVVEDARADGRLVLRPAHTVSAILSRHGATALSPDEVEAALGPIPIDDEG